MADTRDLSYFVHRLDGGIARMELAVEDFAVATLLAEVGAVVPPLITRNGNRFVLDAPRDLGHMSYAD